ncbi:ABC transporter permease [Eoetvoesiella caeni]
MFRSMRLIVEVLRPIPAVALIPLAVLLFGIDGTTKVVLVAYSVFWPMLFQIMYGIRDVDAVARDTVRSYRLSPWNKVRYLLLPSATPYFMTGLRISASIALIVSVATELVISAPGFGAAINVAQAGGAHAEEYGYIVATGLLGWLLSVTFRRMERHVLRWHQSQRGPQ